MPYISFLDLVGMTNKACVFPEDYFRCVKKFVDVLNKATETVSGVKIGVFSDSAYIEAKRLKNLLHAITIIRHDLFTERIYFTASVTTGTFGNDCIIAKNRFSGMALRNGEAIKAYQLQNQLKGVGVNVDEKLAAKVKKTGNYDVVNSIFLKDTKSQNIIGFTDLKYSYDADILFVMLKNAIFEYIKTGYYSNDAQRYYIALITSLLNSFTDKEIVESDSIVSLLEKLSLKEACNVNIEIVLGLIVNRIMNACEEVKKAEGKGVSADEFVLDKIKDEFVYQIIKKLQNIKDCYLRAKNKEILIENYIYSKEGDFINLDYENKYTSEQRNK